MMICPDRGSRSKNQGPDRFIFQSSVRSAAFLGPVPGTFFQSGTKNFNQKTEDLNEDYDGPILTFLSISVHKLLKKYQSI